MALIWLLYLLNRNWWKQFYGLKIKNKIMKWNSDAILKKICELFLIYFFVNLSVYLEVFKEKQAFMFFQKFLVYFQLHRLSLMTEMM
jgi:hypothetical protein